MLRDILLRQFPKLVDVPPHTEAIGGAVRDILLGATPLDVDVECDDPLGCASALGKVITLGRGDLTVYRVVVDGRDPALDHPTKFVGLGYPAAEAARLARERGWNVAEDAGSWRRVVPSPRPLGIVELRAIRALVHRGFVVVAAGGGGIPVTRGADGSFRGVEAVVDKDLVASLLARDLGAERLVISTSVPKVALNYGTPRQRDLDLLTVEEARRHLDAGQFPPGSMGPKIRAAVEFLEHGGRDVIITSPEWLGRAMDGRAGTRIVGRTPS